MLRFFKAVFVKAELPCVGSGAVCIASDLLGPFFACWRRRCLMSTIQQDTYLSSSLKDKTLGSIGLQTMICCSFGWVFFILLITSTCLLL